MSLRDSLDLIKTVRPEAGTVVLDHEIMGERASSLGNAEHRVIETLKAFAEASEHQAELMATAQKAVWEYFVQRELCGFRRHADVIRDLNIPSQVLAGLGASHTIRRRR